MVDGVLLVVDAFDGPMPQTRFVLRKALELGRTPIVVINKIDRPGADPMRVHDEVLDLFIELEADEAQLDAPVVYASAREGVATMDLDVTPVDLAPLFDTIVEARARRRRATPTAPFQMLISTIDYSPYLGRLGIGRIERGHGAASAIRSLLLPMDANQKHEQAARHEALRVRGARAHRGAERARRARSCRSPDSRAWRSASPSPTSSIPERLEGIAVEEPTISRRLPREQLAVRRQGREVRHVAAAARAAVQGAGAQRRAARGGHRLHRHVDRGRARRAASLDPDGDDAARGLRVPGVAAARDHARRA